MGIKKKSHNVDPYCSTIRSICVSGEYLYWRYFIDYTPAFNI